MAGLVDSVASFEARVREVGLGDLWAKFQGHGLTTYANYGFPCSHVPGGTDETQFVNQVWKPLAGDDVQRGPASRRLYFAAYTRVTNDQSQYRASV